MPGGRWRADLSVSPHDAALQRTARRYRRCDRFTRHYVASKLRMDPVHLAVLALAAEAPFGRVMDVGSGRGQMGVALLEAGLVTEVEAVDQDGGALAQLRCAASGLAVHTQHADLADWQGGSADTVLLIDVLYQLTAEQQRALVQAAACAARHRIVIRSSDPARGWRSALSHVLERLGRGWWPTFGVRSNPLALSHLAGWLEGLGFAVLIAPCAAGTPLAGMLLLGTRPA